MLWPETGCLFAGVVECCTSNTVDILYDQRVENKPCRERDIATSRVKSLKKISDFPTTQTLLTKIAKLKQQLDDGQPAEQCVLSNSEIFSLYELVSVQTTQNIPNTRLPQQLSSSPSSSSSSVHVSLDDLSSWYKPEMSESIISVLSNTIMVDIKLDLIDEFVKDRIDSPSQKQKQKEKQKQKLTASDWLKKGRGVDILESCRAFLCTAAVLLSVLSNIPGNNMIIAEEVLDRLAVVPAMFLSIPSYSGSQRKRQMQKKEDNGMDEDRDKEHQQEENEEDFDEKEDEKRDLEEDMLAVPKQVTAKGASTTPHLTQKQYDQAVKTLYNAMGKMAIPIITLYLRLLEQVAQKFKINDKICILTYEMCISALKLDANTNPIADILDNTGGKLILNLQKDAIDLLRAVFRSYPAHRAPIFQELFPVLSQVYSVKKPTRTFALGCSSLTTTSATTSKMSMLLAALMTLIQCVAKFQSDGTFEGSSILDADESLSASFNTVRQLANYFAGELYKRCKKKEVGADFRLAMPKLFNELLSVMGNPDWPVASILLEALVYRLIKEISHVDSDQGVKKDVTYCNQLLDVLANVGASFASIIKTQRIASNREDSIMLTSEIVKQASEKFQQQRSSWMASLGQDKQNLLNSLDNEVVVTADTHDSETRAVSSVTANKRASSRISKQNDKKELQQEEEGLCDKTTELEACRVEFDTKNALSVLIDVTSATVDLLAKHHLPMSPPPPMRVLAQCRNLDDIEKLMPNISNLDISQKIMLNFLELSSSSSSAHVKDAFALTLAMWYYDKSNSNRKFDGLPSYDDLNDPIKDYVSEMIKACSRKDDDSSHINLTSASGGGVLVHNVPTGEVFSINEYSHKGMYSYEFCTKQCKTVLTHRTIQKVYEGILSTILQLLISEPLPTVRARAMKSLHRLLKADPELIQRDTVRDIVIKKGLNDQAISVREESVKLVGTFVLFGFDISSMYLDGLMFCLNDKGVSVRKSVVNIFREVMLHQPNHPLYSEICRCLLVLGWDPKEEETIRDVVSSTFHKVWFSPPSTSVLSSAAKSLRKIDIMSKIETPMDMETCSVADSEVDSIPAIDTSLSSMTTISSSSGTIHTHDGILELPSGWTTYAYPSSERNEFTTSEPPSATKTDSEDQFTPLKGDSEEQADDITSMDVSTTKSNHSYHRVYISPSGAKYFSMNEVKAILSAQEVERDKRGAMLPTTCNDLTGKEPLQSLQASTDSHIEATCFQIVEVIHSLPDTENWMVKMIRDVLHGNNEGEDTNKCLIIFFQLI